MIHRETTQHEVSSWEDSDLWSTTEADSLTGGGGDGPVRGEQRADKDWQRQNVFFSSGGCSLNGAPPELSSLPTKQTVSLGHL